MKSYAMELHAVAASLIQDTKELKPCVTCLVPSEYTRQPVRNQNGGNTFCGVIKRSLEYPLSSIIRLCGSNACRYRS